MRRRTFLCGSVATVLSAPFAGEAQQRGTIRRIGYISTVPSTPLTDAWWQAFVVGLREHGWVEGENIVLERRYADLRKEAALAVAQELVRARVDVIVVSGTLTALATRQATTTVPIVMMVPADPVATGLVGSLASPGGNVTGLSFVGPSWRASRSSRTLRSPGTAWHVEPCSPGESVSTRYSSDRGRRVRHHG
jgi:ABC-type uncharacterized transport system substrate-binding protein